jgi:hypothetical protein
MIAAARAIINPNNSGCFDRGFSPTVMHFAVLTADAKIIACVRHGSDVALQSTCLARATRLIRVVTTLGGMQRRGMLGPWTTTVTTIGLNRPV